MNGIKMSDCKFYVDKEARTVVCVIPNTKNMVNDFVWDHFQWSDMNMSDGIDYLLRRKLRMPDSFRGKAVCAPEDEWNEETGRLVAYDKARDKCYKSFFKRANLLVQLIDERLGSMITMFNEFGMKLDNKRIALHQEIDRRTGAEIEPEEVTEEVEE